jgi:hypothetical protein
MWRSTGETSVSCGLRFSVKTGAAPVPASGASSACSSVCTISRERRASAPNG